MRSQILRDVVAGCAGALLVLAAIGLPGRSGDPAQARSTQPQPAVLLPAFKCQGVPIARPLVNAHVTPCILRAAAPAPVARPAPVKPAVPSP